MRHQDPEDGITAKLSQFVAGTDYQHLTPAVVEYVKVMIADALACGFGASVLDGARRFATVSHAMGGPEDAVVLVSGQKVSAAAAAFANGYLVQALDADDTFYNNGHPLAPIFGAALAAAEEVGASGRDLITAIAVGYDVSIRCRRSFQPRELSASFGSFVMGAAAAVAKLYGFDELQTAMALGNAGFSTPHQGGRWGLMGLGRRHELKYWPNFSQSFVAITSAQLVRAGVVGDRTIFDGPTNFATQLGFESIDENLMFDGLGVRWFINETSVKPWPVCRYFQTAMTLVQEIMAENDLKPDEVDAVSVSAWDLLRAPMWTHFPYIPTEYDAQFSITHAIAALIQGWEMGPEWQRRAVRNPELDAFAEKITVAANQRFADDCVVTPEGFRGMPTVVSVHAGGRELRREGSAALGDGFEGRYRFDLAAIKQKYDAYAKCALSEERVGRTFANIANLENLPDVKFALTT